MKILKSILTLIVFVLMTFASQGQDTIQNDKLQAPGWNFFLKLGSNFTFADVREYDNWVDFNYPGFEARTGFGYYITPWLNPRLEGGFGYLNGISTMQQLEFNSNIIEGAATVNLNLFNMLFGTRFRKFWINVYGGAGMGFYKSKLFHYDDKYLIGSTGQEKRSQMFTYPLGGEICYAATPQVDFHLGYRYTFTSIDDIDVTEGGLNDSYANISFGVTYKLFKKKHKMNDEFEVHCVPELLEKKGDSVFYTIVANYPGNYFDENGVMCLQPILISANGQELFLEPILVKGEKVLGDGHLVMKNGGEIRQSGAFQYLPEFDLSKIIVRPTVYMHEGGELKCPCQDGKKFTVLNDRKVADGIIHTSDRFRNPDDYRYITVGKVTVIKPEPTIIYYQKAKDVIRYTSKYPDEAAILSEINAKANSYMDRVSITAISSASPEGTEKSNVVLAEKRSVTARKLIERSMIKTESSNLHFIAKGEDWEGLNGLLDMYDSKDFVLLKTRLQHATEAERQQIVDEYSMKDTRVENELFPQLRRTVISYDVQLLDEELLAYLLEMYRTSPGELNADELLYLADHVEEFTIQQELLKASNDLRGSNNLAVLYIRDNNYEEAGIQLEEASFESRNYSDEDLGAYWYNKGLLACYKGDYISAKECFSKAESYGILTCEGNGVLLTRAGLYQAALNEFQKKGNCSYNQALTLLLLNKLEEAEKMLECVSDIDGDSFYLNAIAAARKGEKEKLYRHLVRSIEINPSWKEEAQSDAEFKDYRNDENFKVIVNN